jgi:hypothetical protein
LLHHHLVCQQGCQEYSFQQEKVTLNTRHCYLHQLQQLQQGIQQGCDSYETQKRFFWDGSFHQYEE